MRPLLKTFYICTFLVGFIALKNILLNLYEARRDGPCEVSTVIDDEMRSNVWIILTKASVGSALARKFRGLVRSILEYSDNFPLHLNIISDRGSEAVARAVLRPLLPRSHLVKITFHDADRCAELIADIVSAMTPHFSSQPGSYYSDALFYLSLGLYRLAPDNQKQAVLLDCDLHFRTNIRYLFQQFDSFSSTNLFGLAPELTSVYRHVLYNYRNKHNGTRFGSEPNFYEKLNISKIDFTESNIDINYNNSLYELTNNDTPNFDVSISKEQKGFPGFNSGVVLLDLEKIRGSNMFQSLIKNESVRKLTERYLFKGHLGDQDFYTLLGYEMPEMFYFLDCGWNRQLCKWWRRYEDGAVFDDYFRCNSTVNVYHGNCNTPIPFNK